MSAIDDEPTVLIFGDYPNVDERKCRLLGPTALIVQSIMGVLVILSLLYKRHKEKPKRPWKIWVFDVSKQVVGQAFVHGVNVLISDLAAHHSSKNPCVMYFLNILIDTTAGVGILYLLIHIATYVLSDKCGLKGFRTGEYGDPPSVSYWARQAVVYVFSLTTMKLLVVGLFLVWPGLVKIGAWLLSWTGGGDAAQVIVVMGLFPIVMNVLQFWLIDSIVKASAPSLSSESVSGESSDREPLFGSRDFEDDQDDAPCASRHDIENPPPRSHSKQRPIDSGKASDIDEGKYASLAASSPSTPANGVENVEEFPHEFPPSSPSPDDSSAFSSGRESPLARAVPSKRLTKRSLPPPLQQSSASYSLTSSPSIIAIGSSPVFSGSGSSRGSPSGASAENDRHLGHERRTSQSSILS